MSNAAKNVDTLATGSSVLHNYFNTYYYFDYLLFWFQQNYFSDLYPAKILDLSAKPFFPCRQFHPFASIKRKRIKNGKFSAM